MQGASECSRTKNPFPRTFIHPPPSLTLTNCRTKFADIGSSRCVAHGVFHVRGNVVRIDTGKNTCAYFFKVCQSAACDSVTFAVGPVVVVVLGAVRVRVFVG